MSDPTLYSREALVNDRRREKAHLQEVLEASKTVEFKSELRRELLSIFALTSRLGIAFDPGASADFLNAQRQADAQTALNVGRLGVARDQLDAQNLFEQEQLRQNREANRLIEQNQRSNLQAQLDQRQLRQQIDLVRLQSELELLQARLDQQRRQIAAAEAGLPASGTQTPLPDSALGDVTAGTLPSARDSGLSQTGNPQLLNVTSLRGIDLDRADTASILARLDQQVASLRTLLADRVPLAREAEVELSPEADFEARQAYRRTVRSALAENDLDDLHDLDGNSLYRMQFRATILPGARKAKWGVARYRIVNPVVEQGDLDQLYLEWLAHASHRMNTRESFKNDDGRSSVGDNRYELLAAGTGLFEVARIAFVDPEDDAASRPSAFDPCRQSLGQRQREALGCESIALAVPRGMSGRVSSALSSFQETFLATIVTQLRRAKSRGQSTVLDSFLGSRNIANGASYTDLQCKLFLPDEDPSMGIGSRSTRSLKDLFSLVHRIAKKRVSSGGRATDDDYQSAYILLEEAWKKFAGQKADEDKIPKEVSDYIDNLGKLKKAKTEDERKKIQDALRAGEPAVLGVVMAMIAQFDLADLKTLMPPRLAFETAVDFVQAAPAVAKSAEGALGRVNLKPNQLRMLNHLVEEFEVGAQAARGFLSMFFAHHSGIEECSIEQPGVKDNEDLIIAHDTFPTTKAPDQFREVLTDDDQTSVDDGYVRLGGLGYAYSTQPVERTQRVSTIANAAEAYEFALALAGQAPQSGFSGDGGLGATRQATGKVQARENAPLVVGFSRSGDQTPLPRLQEGESIDDGRKALEANAQSQFGWVFGPRVQLDAENNQLKLIQHVKPYDVSADLSLPGWWPHVGFKLQTVWIGNWRDEKLISLRKPDDGESFVKVRLHSNRADMDGLTNELSKALLGRSLHATLITRVVPEAISRCADPNNLLIYGANVWRSTEVYLDGVAAIADSIRVLPDMEGISARFPNEALRGRSHELGNDISLVVWTRDGSDEYKIPLTGSASDTSCTDVRRSDPPDIRIAEAHPSQISVCGEKSAFLVSVRGITGDFKATLGGIKSSKPRKHATSADGKVVVIEFDVEHGLDAWSGLPTVKLVVAGKEGVASGDVTLVGDRRDCKASAGTPISTEPAEAKITKVATTYGRRVMDACLPSGTVTVEGTDLSSIVTAEWLGRRVAVEAHSDGKIYSASFTELPVLSKAPTGDSSNAFVRFLDVNGEEVTSEPLSRALCSTAQS